MILICFDFFKKKICFLEESILSTPNDSDDETPLLTSCDERVSDTDDDDYNDDDDNDDDDDFDVLVDSSLANLDALACAAMAVDTPSLQSESTAKKNTIETSEQQPSIDALLATAFKSMLSVLNDETLSNTSSLSSSSPSSTSSSSIMIEQHPLEQIVADAPSVHGSSKIK